MSRLFTLLSAAWFPPPSPTPTTFTGKTLLITGANTGLGYEAALKLTQLSPSKVILAVRSLAKGQIAKEKIEALTGRKGVVEVWTLDMADYGSITAFAKRVGEELEELDYAVLNAGVNLMEYRESKYGYEETIQINTLSTALLGLLLLPKLKATATKRKSKDSTDDEKPVLEFISSVSHRHAVLTNKNRDAPILIESEKSYGMKQYGFSKLMLMYAMKSLSQLALSANGEPAVIVLGICPGLCKSDLAREYEGLLWSVVKAIIYGVFAKTTEVGARSYVKGLLVGEEGHGGFFMGEGVMEDTPLLQGEEGEELRKRVWHEILDALRKEVPEVVELAKA
ncbi:NAD(P)-binding protein [Aulographum hederae CBS 113979]|uniref:NAD(P)-binding protein n=1 Tax=Aulographum hederae CBS 113979 TaxID=1176131 RepID=A0A6G1HEG1_9PEZI|nr:NAD(P)-binding protein [Aulographum hederae CBS 113979]